MGIAWFGTSGFDPPPTNSPADQPACSLAILWGRTGLSIRIRSN
jgi:hypothetical protein